MVYLHLSSPRKPQPASLQSGPMFKRLSLCILACMMFNRLAAADTQTWEFRAGRWMKAPDPTTAPAVDEPMLDQAEQLLVQHDPKTAKKILLAWEKVNKHSPVRDRCIFLFSEVFFQQDDRIKSFFFCDELMDEYPESKLFQAALQKQFDIAYDYLNGYKDTFLGMRILDMGTEGVQMMWRIQQRSPGSPLAEKGLRAPPIIISTTPTTISPKTPTTLTSRVTPTATRFRG